MVPSICLLQVDQGCSPQFLISEFILGGKLTGNEAEVLVNISKKKLRRGQLISRLHYNCTSRMYLIPRVYCVVYYRCTLIALRVALRMYALIQAQRKIGAMHQHAQIRLPSHLLVPLLVLLTSTSPHSCSGACAKLYTVKV